MLGCLAGDHGSAARKAWAFIVGAVIRFMRSDDILDWMLFVGEVRMEQPLGANEMLAFVVF